MNNLMAKFAARLDRAVSRPSLIMNMADALLNRIARKGTAAAYYPCYWEYSVGDCVLFQPNCPSPPWMDRHKLKRWCCWGGGHYGCGDWIVYGVECC